MEQQKYELYLFHCNCEGDIWFIHNRPYTFEEWKSNGMPQYGGVSINKV